LGRTRVRRSGVAFLAAIEGVHEWLVNCYEGPDAVKLSHVEIGMADRIRP
jgi:hypothetical protein